MVRIGISSLKSHFGGTEKWVDTKSLKSRTDPSQNSYLRLLMLSVVELESLETMTGQCGNNGLIESYSVKLLK